MLVVTDQCWAQHVDIFIARDGRQLVTGAFDFGTGEARVPQRVFLRGFEAALAGGAVTGNDPGFNALNQPPAPLLALPASTPVSIWIEPISELPELLGYWDGSGHPSLGAPPGREGFEVALAGVLGNLEELRVVAGGPPPEAFEFTTTDPLGALHQHLQFTLRGSEERPPTPGVYAVPLALGMDGLRAASAWLVMPHEVTEEVGLAMQRYLQDMASDAAPQVADEDAGAMNAAATDAAATDAGARQAADDVAVSDPEAPLGSTDGGSNAWLPSGDATTEGGCQLQPNGWAHGGRAALWALSLAAMLLGWRQRRTN